MESHAVGDLSFSIHKLANSLMKKPQRSFVIEYKSGRRSSAVKQPSSIWGNLDLKSVARDVETVLPAERSDAAGSRADLVSRLQATATPVDIAAPSAVQDDAVPIDRHALVEACAPSVASELKPSVETEKLDKSPRAQPTKSKTKSLVTPQKIAGKSQQSMKQIPHSSKPLLPTQVTEELDDLLQLEEENRQLKRRLVARLRAENSWLRERLLRG